MNRELLLPEGQAPLVPWHLRPLGVEEIAEFLKRSPGYVRSMVNHEEFPQPITSGSRSRRWLAGEVIEFIQLNREHHTNSHEIKPINIHYLPKTSGLRPKRRKVS